MEPNEIPPIPSIAFYDGAGGVLGLHIDPAEFVFYPDAVRFGRTLITVLEGSDLIGRPLNERTKEAALLHTRARAFTMVTDHDLWRTPGGKWLLATEGGT